MADERQRIVAEALNHVGRPMAQERHRLVLSALDGIGGALTNEREPILLGPIRHLGAALAGGGQDLGQQMFDCLERDDLQKIAQFAGHAAGFARGLPGAGRLLLDQVRPLRPAALSDVVQSPGRRTRGLARFGQTLVDHLGGVGRPMADRRRQILAQALDGANHALAVLGEDLMQLAGVKVRHVLTHVFRDMARPVARAGKIHVLDRLAPLAGQRLRPLAGQVQSAGHLPLQVQVARPLPQLLDEILHIHLAEIGGKLLQLLAAGGRGRRHPFGHGGHPGRAMPTMRQEPGQPAHRRRDAEADARQAQHIAVVFIEILKVKIHVQRRIVLGARVAERARGRLGHRLIRTRSRPGLRLLCAQVLVHWLQPPFPGPPGHNLARRPAAPLPSK